MVVGKGQFTRILKSVLIMYTKHARAHTCIHTHTHKLIMSEKLLVYDNFEIPATLSVLLTFSILLTIQLIIKHSSLLNSSNWQDNLQQHLCHKYNLLNMSGHLVPLWYQEYVTSIQGVSEKYPAVLNNSIIPTWPSQNNLANCRTSYDANMNYQAPIGLIWQQDTIK